MSEMAIQPLLLTSEQGYGDDAREWWVRKTIAALKIRCGGGLRQGKRCQRLAIDGRGLCARHLKEAAA